MDDVILVSTRLQYMIRELQGTIRQLEALQAGATVANLATVGLMQGDGQNALV